MSTVEVLQTIRVIFFFQAEDGIRDGRVTGVQTCALPILGPRSIRTVTRSIPPRATVTPVWPFRSARSRVASADRSEERRVGKECRARGAPDEQQNDY